MSEGQKRAQRMAIAGASGGVPSTMLTIFDEGVPLASNTTGIDFVGAGVTATGSGPTKTVTIPGASSPLTTKGDLYGHSTVDARVPVGADGTILTADSAAATGVSWQTPSVPTVNGLRVGPRIHMALDPAASTVTGFGITLAGSTWQASSGLSATLYGQMIRILAGTSASFQALNFRNTGGSANMYYRGNAAGRGGFTLRWIFGVNAVVDTANFKYFVGLRALTSASATSFVPSDGVDCVYIGRDAGDTNMQLMHNDSGLTCTKIDLGSDFPAATAGIGIVLDLTCAGNDGNITYKVQRYDTAGITPKTGTISSNLPTNSTFMNPHMFVCNGTSGTPGVAALDHVMVVADVPYMVFTP